MEQQVTISQSNITNKKLETIKKSPNKNFEVIGRFKVTIIEKNLITTD